ncbi:MAG TPA: hypothetical protein VFS21_31525 [Roseiflexaceae bacterium]|nr:hypothetical protein [Roseiflexaceae bacterium]
MHEQRETLWAHPPRVFAGLAGLVLAVAGLLLIGQLLAALLMPLVVALAVELRRRDRRALALARRLAQDQPADKIEVPRGPWGELARAVNSLQQQRRLEERLHNATAAPLPEDAVQALLDGIEPNEHEPRVVTVLVVSCGDAERAANRRRRALLSAWQAVARAARDQAGVHGALLQPCGDALLLAFGAFSERPADATALAAVQAAERIRQTWDQHQPDGAPLALSIASGSALVAMLPGLGYCVLGAPVDQALTMGRLALDTLAYRMLCDEGAFFALPRMTRDSWRATGLDMPGESGVPLTVYGRPTRL